MAGHVGCVRLLLRAGAFKELQEPDADWTALRRAEERGHISVALLLQPFLQRTPEALTVALPERQRGATLVGGTD